MGTDNQKSILKRSTALLSEIEQYENKLYLLKLITYASKVLLRKSPLDRRTVAAILLRRLLYHRVVPHMSLEVCSPCQHRCEYCAHADLIGFDPSYQLSMDNLRKFIFFTKESKYFIENLWIHGPGEPTLWRHFNEGVQMLHASGVIGSINIETNGQSLDRITDETWRCIAFLSVSLYPSSKTRNLDPIRKKQSQFGFLMKVLETSSFKVFPTTGCSAALPAICNTPGPMIYADKVFYYCGPPVFQAAKLLGVDLMQQPGEHSSELKPNYLSGVQTNQQYGIYPKARNNLELCRYCWANRRIVLDTVAHSKA